MQPLLVDLHLERVHTVREGLQPVAQLALLVPDRLQLGVAAGPLGLFRRELHPCLGEGPVDRGQHHRQVREHPFGRGDLGPADDREPCRFLGRGTLGLELPFQLVGASALGTRAFPGGLDLQPVLDLGGPGGVDRVLRRRSGRRVDDGLRPVGELPERGLRLGQRRVGRGRRAVGLGQGSTQTVDLGRGVLGACPGGRAGPVVLGARAGVLTRGTVGLVHRASCRLDRGPRGLEARGRVRRLGHDGPSSRLGGVPVGDEFDAGRGPCPAAGHPGSADQVAGPRDHRGVRGGGEHGLQVDVVVRDQRVGQQGGEGGRALHQVERPVDRRRQHGRQSGTGAGNVGDDHVDAAEVGGPGVLDGAECDRAVVGEDGVGQAVERRGDGRLEPGRHREAVGQAADDARTTGVDDGLGAVAHVDRQRQGGDPGVQRVPLTLERVQPVAVGVPVGLRVVELLARGGEGRGEGVLVGVEGRVTADVLERGGRLLGTGDGLGQRPLPTFPVVRGRGALRPGDLHRTRQPLPVEVVLRDQGGLRGDLLVEGVERGTGGTDLLGDGRRAGLHVASAVVEPVGLGTDAGDPLRGDRRTLLRRLGLLRQEHQALVREHRQAAEALLHALEPVHHGPGAVHVVADHARLDLLLALPDLVEPLLQHDHARTSDRSRRPGGPGAHGGGAPRRPPGAAPSRPVRPRRWTAPSGRSRPADRAASAAAGSPPPGRTAG